MSRRQPGGTCVAGMEESPVVDAFLKIRCSKQTHINCTDMQDLLLESCINVTEATTVRPYSAPVYCVFAMAKVDRDRLSRFERKVRNLERDGLEVADLSMDVVRNGS
ncbi:hypothetical protein IBTHAUMO2_410012 [Nitrosopumilaceae archaeon]|nr:hypothetical protein [Nitrosopumilus sp.]CAI9831765.1 hypothetical protein IBTHAUMO2_410012 [Nitrosopumilaceae archaeon]MDA7944412.1 hypothetical protein [Nitrosopumilus sp.]MDA7954164.1 hypothetical protein [Nitrosopumilus sp.]MDA7973240.1 hypothetical protein [Nitrosopumilus sp.]